MAGSVTLKDIALEAQVSVGIVSRIFNNHINVTEEVRQHMLKAATQSGYFGAAGQNVNHGIKSRMKMPLKPQQICLVPEEAARIARTTHPKGNVYMHMREIPGTIHEDQTFVICSHVVDNRLKRPGGLLWSPSCNLLRA